MNVRESGVLMHITSLPSRFGIGDLGPAAFRFADLLKQTRQSYWQILPTNPTESTYDHSPYHSISAFAGNPLLISPEKLVEDGWLKKSDLGKMPDFPGDHVDFPQVEPIKMHFLATAFSRFDGKRPPADFQMFCEEQSSWLEDFALFAALKEQFHEKPLSEWPEEIRNRHPNALDRIKMELKDLVQKNRFYQYAYYAQWRQLKNYCNLQGIKIIGDIPIYVNGGSADLWTHSEIFKLDSQKKPTVVAGVPPDYFSRTGQLWGNPIYDWNILKNQGYQWWIDRIKHNLRLYDLVRIDHFRGLVAYWEVPAHETTAIPGRWIDVPVLDFFNHLLRQIPILPVIAEDLGVITPDVREIISKFQLPGMKVLLFAFGEDMPSNVYIPHNLVRNCILYTGTHDNNTIRGWFDNEASEADRQRVFQYFGRKIPVQNLHWEFIRLAMMSVADIVIFPMQDIIGLDQRARMNRPSTMTGNWRWRLEAKQIKKKDTETLGSLTQTYGRT